MVDRKQPSRDSLRSLARSHMSTASDGFEGEDFQRLPSSPARLDIELPEAALDLTMDFNSILAVAEGAPKDAQSVAE